jgi:mannose/fructose/N-acetylgalactosamine-specific phosphotransferase system component IIC
MSILVAIPLQVLLIWLACHFIGDFAFQSAWMSMEKGKSWEVNFYHCATYTAVFVLFAHTTPLATAALFGTHFVVDPLKARYNFIKPIWLDQLLHVLTIVLILFLHYAFPELGL